MDVNQELLAHGLLLQWLQPFVNILPELGLLIGVGNIGYGLAHLELLRNFGDVISSFNILHILELRMLFALIDFLKRLPDRIEVGEGPGKPGDWDRISFEQFDAHHLKILFGLLVNVVVVGIEGKLYSVLDPAALLQALEVSAEVGEVDSIAGEDIAHPAESSGSVQRNSSDI